MIFYLQRVSKFIREAYHFCRVFIWDNCHRKELDDTIKIAYNGYSTQVKLGWFIDFISTTTGKKVVYSWHKPDLIFSSSFGSYWLLVLILKFHPAPSIFFSEENLRTLKKYREYQCHLGQLPTLSMGFDHIDRSNYHRLPLWILYLFPPDFLANANIESIQNKLDEFEKRAKQDKELFACMIASHDGYDIAKKIYGKAQNVLRSDITEEIGKIAFVHCPGKLLHNDDTLKNLFEDNKKKYLLKFRFNICAENASSSGYVTEKLFEAIEAGAIPIYWGDKNPEPNIINRERIIFWQDNGQNEANIQLIKNLNNSQNARDEFHKKPIFTKNAAKHILAQSKFLRTFFNGTLSK
ncbi:MAG: glycosyltransferase family 10 [Desulfotalea sp.]